MPNAVAKMLSVFELINVNITGFRLPLQCFGLGNYEQQLLFTMFAPVILALVVAIGFVIRARCGCRFEKHGTGLLSALPWLLVLSFLVFPVVRNPP